jgi:hypothetical protein
MNEIEDKTQGMETINDRLKLIVEKYFRGNVSLFCRDIDVRQSTMNEIMGKKQISPSANTMAKIINGKSVSIDAAWLMTGHGNELVSHPDKVRGAYPIAGNENVKASTEELQLEAKIKLLWEINEKLQLKLDKANQEYAVLKYHYDQQIESEKKKD